MILHVMAYFPDGFLVFLQFLVIRLLVLQVLYFKLVSDGLCHIGSQIETSYTGQNAGDTGGICGMGSLLGRVIDKSNKANRRSEADDIYDKPHTFCQLPGPGDPSAAKQPDQKPGRDTKIGGKRMQGSLCQWGHIPIGQPDLETNIFSYKIKNHQYWIQYYTNRNTLQYFPFKEYQQIQQKEEKNRNSSGQLLRIYDGSG